MPMRAAGSTGTPGPAGSLTFDQVNTITVAANYRYRLHNSGNMIDKDWIFLDGWAAHYTNQVLEVTGSGNTRNVDMSGWMVAWDGISLDMGAGSPAIINNNDGIWGNGNDTLDYSAITANGPFAGVTYGLHMVGSYTPVPVPAAAWLLGSGLLGLMGVARRKGISCGKNE